MRPKNYFSVMKMKKTVSVFEGVLLKSVLSWCILLGTWSLNAQSDTLSVGDGVVAVDSIPEWKGKVMSTRWMLLDMGFNSFQTANPNVDFTPLGVNTGKSLQFNLHVFRQKTSLYKNKLNLEYAFGLDFNRYEWSQPYVLEPYSQVVSPGLVDTVTYKRNSLHTASLLVPFLVQFESNPGKLSRSFRVGAGAYGGIILGVKNKLRDENGRKQTIKGNYNMPEIKYGIVGEVGFSYLTLYYKFELSPFFVDAQDNGFKMYATTIGIRLIPFIQ